MRELIRLGRWIYPYKGRLAAATFCSFVAVLCLTTAAILIQPIFERMVRETGPAAGSSTLATVMKLEGASATPGSADAPAEARVGEPAVKRDDGGSAGFLESWKLWGEQKRDEIQNALRIPEFKDWLAADPYKRLPLLIILLALLKGAFGFLAEFHIRWVAYRMISDLRADLYDRILNQSARFYSRNTTGQLMSRVLGDVGKLQKITSTNFADFIRLFFTIISFVVVVFYISWSLSLLCLVGLPALVYPIARLSRRVKKTSTQSQARAADLSNLLSETILGNRIVKGFGMEAFESQRFRDALQRMFKVDIKSVRTMALTPPILEMVGAAYLASLLWYAGSQVAAGTLAASSLATFIVGLTLIFISVKKLSLMNNDLQQALGAALRVFEIHDAPCDIEDRPDAVSIKAFERQIEFRGVRFRYENAIVLDGIDLTIRAGEMVALVGLSGAGKTTLVNLIPRFYDVTEGGLFLDGLEVRNAKITSLRQQIALVTQETILFNESVRNNIAYGNEEIPFEKIEAAAKAANAHGFITALPRGYETLVGERGASISAGQRQRLTIARAILKNAPILILDEATSALDPESESLVQQALETLMLRRTSIVIAHRLSTIQRADRICVLSGGKIVEVGSHRELLAADGHYARLYRMQFRDPAPAG